MAKSSGILPTLRGMIAFLSIVFFVQGSCAEDYSDVVFVPREVFVGDLAELTFSTIVFDTILAPGEERTIPRSLAPVSQDMTIETITFRRFASGPGTKIIIAMRPWSTGNLQIPTIVLEGISLVPPSVRVESLIDKTGLASLQPARPPLLIPGTAMKVLLSILFLLGAAILSLTLGKRVLSAVFLDSPLKRSRKRQKILAKALRSLERMLNRTERQEWYAQFSSAAREYFGSVCDWYIARVNMTTYALTAREFRSALETAFAQEEWPLESREATADLIDRSVSMLARVEDIRFSGKAGTDQRAIDVRDLTDLAASLERHIVELCEIAARQKEPAFARSN